jgi:hypothetical protein
MNHVERDWQRDPFRPGKVTLDALVVDFLRRVRTPGSLLHRLRDDIVDFCADADGPEEAIIRACRSKRPNGKHHNHQSRVPQATLRLLQAKLLRVQGNLAYSNDFDQLYRIIDKHKPDGIGPVTTYDVATRIGAYLGLNPKHVYIKAGTRTGLLELMRHYPWTWKVTYKMPLRSFPPPMRSRMNADQIEDFLCSYRETFHLIGQIWHEGDHL